MNLRLTFDSRDLVPMDWQKTRENSEFYIFNPALLSLGEEWLLAYRVTTPAYELNRIAACRLDANLRVVPGSVSPLSDTFKNAQEGIGDPRLIHHQGKIYLSYCHFYPRSEQYLVELQADGLSARSPSRLLTLNPRQVHEKNWMLFSHAGQLLAVYSIAPHVILRLNLEDKNQVDCERAYAVDWQAADYVRRFGELRGGANPCRVGDLYFSFFHTSRFQGWLHPLARKIRKWMGRTPPEISNSAETPKTGWLLGWYRRLFVHLYYYGGFYGFSAGPPFAPQYLARQPILLPTDEPPPQKKPRLRPIARQVVFPSSAHFWPARQTWLVAYGVHDERFVLRTFAHQELLRQCQKL
jgi:hypothetical protein